MKDDRCRSLVIGHAEIRRVGRTCVCTGNPGQEPPLADCGQSLRSWSRISTSDGTQCRDHRRSVVLRSKNHKTNKNHNQVPDSAGNRQDQCSVDSYAWTGSKKSILTVFSGLESGAVAHKKLGEFLTLAFCACSFFRGTFSSQKKCLFLAPWKISGMINI